MHNINTATCAMSAPSPSLPPPLSLSLKILFKIFVAFPRGNLQCSSPPNHQFSGFKRTKIWKTKNKSVELSLIKHCLDQWFVLKEASEATAKLCGFFRDRDLPILPLFVCLIDLPSLVIHLWAALDLLVPNEHEAQDIPSAKVPGNITGHLRISRFLLPSYF